MNYWLITLQLLLIWNIISVAIIYITVLPKLRKFWYKIYWLSVIVLIINLGILLV